MHIIVEVGSIPASKDKHLSSSNQVGRVVETGSRCTTSFGALVPGHSDRIKRVQVSEDVTLASLSAKDDYSRASEHCSVAVARSRRCSRNLGLDPPGRVDVKHVSVVEIGETSVFSIVEVATEDHKGCSC